MAQIGQTVGKRCPSCSHDVLICKEAMLTGEVIGCLCHLATRFGLTNKQIRLMSVTLYWLLPWDPISLAGGIPNCCMQFRLIIKARSVLSNQKVLFWYHCGRLWPDLLFACRVRHTNGEMAITRGTLTAMTIFLSQRDSGGD